MEVKKRRKNAAKIARATMPLVLEENIEGAALAIVNHLERMMDGPVNKPSTWRRIAKLMDLEIEEYHAPGCGRGEFIAYPLGSIPPNVVGKVIVNTGYSLRQIAQAYAHECAHAELHRWHPPRSDEQFGTYMYEGGFVDDIRHEIARRVEEILFE